MIEYRDSIIQIQEQQLDGFFVGWVAAPDNAMFLKTLHGSSHVWLALENQKVVGYIYAISDGVMAAFIPMLEVLPRFGASQPSLYSVSTSRIW